MTRLALLGPQRFNPSIEPVLKTLGLDGPVCVVTAGWQEREGELRELEADLDCEVTDLQLYRRAEAVFAADPELFQAHRQRQLQLKEMQRLYRFRLSRALEVTRELFRADGDAKILNPERRSAMAALRTLDRQHLRRIRRVHTDFEDSWQPQRRPAVRAQREELAAILAGCGAVLIAGGHVAVLLNRMRLFGFASLISAMPVIAWSAGAMALSERIVLFHDNPPQGAGDAEILDAGLGLFHGLLPLPHARQRLALDDPLRVTLFARRFAPALCVTLERGTTLHWDEDALYSASGASRLARNGQVLEVALH